MQPTYPAVATTPDSCLPIPSDWWDVGDDGLRRLHEWEAREVAALEANPEATAFDAMTPKAQEFVLRMGLGNKVSTPLAELYG